jgi:large subunit ribosomal protein L29
MASTAAVEARSLGDEELVSQLREAKEELFNLRFQVATGQLDNNRRLQIVRRSIARIYTVMRERELGITYATTVAPAESVEEPVKASAKKAKAEKAAPDAAETAATAKTVASTDESVEADATEVETTSETKEVDA